MELAQHSHLHAYTSSAEQEATAKVTKPSVRSDCNHVANRTCSYWLFHRKFSLCVLRAVRQAAAAESKAVAMEVLQAQPTKVAEVEVALIASRAITVIADLTNAGHPASSNGCIS